MSSRVDQQKSVARSWVQIPTRSLNRRFESQGHHNPPSREQNWTRSLDRMALTATLANQGYLWAHDWADRASVTWLTLPWDTARTALSQREEGEKVQKNKCSLIRTGDSSNTHTHTIPGLRSNIRSLLSCRICLFIRTILWILCNGNWTRA